MSVYSSRLSLSSPLKVARALAGDDGYHFGIPREALNALPVGAGGGRFVFYQDGTLKEGDYYIDTLDNWLQFTVGLGYSEELVRGALRLLGKGKRASIALSILGYIPLQLKIPKEGSVSYSPHGKVVLIGEFGANGQVPVEEWSASMSYDVVGPDVGAMPERLPDDTLEAIAAAWRPFFTVDPNSDNGAIPNTVTLTQVAYYRAKADGNATGGQWQRHTLSPVCRGLQPARNPIQIANVITLDAGGPKKGRFGRFYLPATGAPVGADYRWSSDIPNTTLTRARTALTAANVALSADIDGDVELVVASGVGSGENRPVRNIRCGRVPDTMRSRREGLDEGYFSLPFQAIP